MAAPAFSKKPSAALKEAESRLADPEVSAIVRRIEKQFTYHAVDAAITEAVLNDLDVLREP